MLAQVSAHGIGQASPVLHLILTYGPAIGWAAVGDGEEFCDSLPAKGVMQSGLFAVIVVFGAEARFVRFRRSDHAIGGRFILLTDRERMLRCFSVIVVVRQPLSMPMMPPFIGHRLRVSSLFSWSALLFSILF